MPAAVLLRYISRLVEDGRRHVHELIEWAVFDRDPDGERRREWTGQR
jgi:hypothetical protein